ncbi:MAG: response regulator [Brevundimonas sp.]|nr:response regulator [Brevundimonas sp.]
MSASILVVDDDAELAAAAVLFLTQAGYEARSAPNGAAALVQLVDAPVDLVLMDIRMQGMDGVETLRRIRKSGNDVPVVMMTADGRPEVVRDVLATGGNGYLMKPFEPEDVIARVRKALDAAKIAPR